MKRLGKAISHYVDALAPEQAQQMHNAQNNEIFARAIRNLFSKNPAIGEYLLQHTNYLYIAREKAAWKANAGKPPLLIHVYLDDAAARAELNAYREWVLLELKKYGMHLDKMIIHTATLGMKERHLYPQAGKQSEASTSSATTLSNPDDSATPNTPFLEDLHAKEALRHETKMKENLKRAICMSFETLEQAESFLSFIEDVRFDVVPYNYETQRGYPAYFCKLYTSDTERLNQVLNQQLCQTIISKARQLNLRLQSIHVYESHPEYRGKQAFPRFAL